ncbi:hypothetical protein FACS1894186_6940 [Alphaproteobacteria bacterium]|nr:hypothetical protein FACS1894186_6940 [Alphaproteobacteria bacterium]
MKCKIIQELEAAQIAARAISFPKFTVGDTVQVWVKVVDVVAKKGSKTTAKTGIKAGGAEQERERLQMFKGVVIARKNRSINSNFTVRKISFGESVERVFQLYSPLIAKVEVASYGKVRRAKLYYLRDRRGRAARIAEDTAAVANAKQEAMRAKAAEAEAAGSAAQ